MFGVPCFDQTCVTFEMFQNLFLSHMLSLPLHGDIVSVCISDKILHLRNSYLNKKLRKNGISFNNFFLTFPTCYVPFLAAVDIYDDFARRLQLGQ